MRLPPPPPHVGLQVAPIAKEPEEQTVVEWPGRPSHPGKPEVTMNREGVRTWIRIAGAYLASVAGSLQEYPSPKNVGMADRMTTRLGVILLTAAAIGWSGCTVVGLLAGLEATEPTPGRVISGTDAASGTSALGSEVRISLIDRSTVTGEFLELRHLPPAVADSIVHRLPHPPIIPHLGDSVWLVFRSSADHVRWIGVDKYAIITENLRTGIQRGVGLDSLVRIIKEDGNQLNPQELRMMMAVNRLPAMTNLIVTHDGQADPIAVASVAHVQVINRGGAIYPAVGFLVGFAIDVFLGGAIVRDLQELW